jgi:hypothetical protein
MPRVSSVQYADVAAACQSLFQSGEPPSFNRVYAALGNRGSGRVVSDLIRRWRAEAGSRLSIMSTRSLPGVPDALVQDVDAMLLKAWQLALAESETAYEEASALLDAERITWQQQLDAAGSLAADIQTLRAVLAERTAAWVELQNLRQSEQLARADLDARLTAAKEELAHLQATQEADALRHAEALSTLAARHTAALALDQARAEGDRRHTAQITDELRQAAKAAELYLREQLDGTRVAAESYRTRAGQATTDAAKWRARAEIAEAALAKASAPGKRYRLPQRVRP